MTSRAQRSHLELAPPTSAPDASERQRLAALLRRTAAAVAAPHQRGEGLWTGNEDSLTARSVWSMLDAVAGMIDAGHLTEKEMRAAFVDATGALHIAQAF